MLIEIREHYNNPEDLLMIRKGMRFASKQGQLQPPFIQTPGNWAQTCENGLLTKRSFIIVFSLKIDEYQRHLECRSN